MPPEADVKGWESLALLLDEDLLAIRRPGVLG
jgi:hypothetical protein